MFMFMIDLDELPQLVEAVPILSHNERNVYSFRDDDHLYLGQADLRDNVWRYLQRNGIEEKPRRIELVTQLRCFGYVFNPVSFYICRDGSDQAYAMIAQVHNTFGELKPFLVRRDAQHESLFRSDFDKHFYISPFSGLNHKLALKLHVPDRTLSMHVRCHNEGEAAPFLYAGITGGRVPLTTARLALFSLKFPLVTLKVMFMIHWHAFRLYRLGVPFHRKHENPQLQQGIYPKKHQSQ